ncbi:hypothetical protein U14_04946 [Candidatus Moduliflexus flocculans]|uniref:5-bromo-4-chloroindolyl phosphate hydrolysis protein n=1 Tax=Candidatus Moduliflexus flocculans TaxID=1499966 RepID=A0A0S6W570_9BACT|nr:hypothetical protein U14_04946 [Candidatus Moduliflexus flocculans]
MENFIDLFLMLLIVVVIVITGGLIFLFLKDPIAAYRVVWSIAGIIFAGTGVAGWKFYQKKRLGSYKSTLQELLQLYKEITQTTRYLDSTTKKTIRTYFPKIRQLRYEAQRRIYKILEIEKDLRKIEKQQFTDSLHALSSSAVSRYKVNINAIERAKSQHLQDIQHIIRFFHEINTQLLALKYTNEKTIIQDKIAEMIDDLLIDMQTLEEITGNTPQ